MGAWGSSEWGNSPWEGSTATAPIENRDEFTYADVEYDCLKSVNSNIGQGVIVIGTTIVPDYIVHESDVITIGATLPSGGYSGFTQATGNISIGVAIALRGGDVSISVGPGNGWIWTSRIGALDFADDISGEVVKMIMPYSGLIYKIMKLGSSVMVYAENGVSKLIPAGVNWGVITMHNVGVLSKNAATGNDKVHYFIDNLGVMYKVVPEANLEQLDYSQLMSNLSGDTVMSYDDRRGFTYITDNTLGYVLSEDGLGECPPTLTGVGYKDATFYVTSTTAITNSPFEIVTDIVDFGSRLEKTITEITAALSVSNDIYVAIDHRQKKSDSWSSTSWRRLDDEGIASFITSGVDFRFKIKLTSYEAIQLEEFKVFGNGVGLGERRA